MATNNSANIPTAAAGKVLQGAGVGSTPTFSTPTYPSASGTSRKILVSDGTNNVYSTETWAVPGTSGNVLTSDGTNWTSAAPSGGGTTTITGTLTNAQIKALHATPVQVIAAPGAGKFIQILDAAGKMNYGGTSAFTAAAGQAVIIAYGTANAPVTLMTNGGIVSTATFVCMISAPSSLSVVNTSFDNTAMNLYNASATEISGNAANDNTITYSITYRIVTI